MRLAGSVSVALVVLAALARTGSALGAAPGADLSAFAAASPRPRECRHAGALGKAWDRARHPGVRAFCRALARGYAALATEPERAIRAAKEADEALGRRAEPLVLEGRALAQLGRFEGAFEKLAAAERLSPASLNAPEALYALGLAAFRTGHLDVALGAYRALAPRLSLVESPEFKQRAYVEAGALSMRAGPAGVDEALGYLNEARRLPSVPGLSDYVLGALALALDRAGRVEEARGVAASADGPWRLARDEDEGSRTPLVALPPGEQEAMAAVLAERRDAELARRLWEAFLDANPEGWLSQHAKDKLRALGRKGR